ncbi:MAG: hypothetical protein ACI35S_05340 [Anaeroplasma sp.]
MPKNNTLLDLHNLLMEAATRIMDADTPEELEKEIKVSKAVSMVGKVIVDNANTVLQSQSLALEYGATEAKAPNEIFAIEHKKE